MATCNTFLAGMNNCASINDKAEMIFSKSGRIFLATHMRKIRSIDDDRFQSALDVLRRDRLSPTDLDERSQWDALEWYLRRSWSMLLALSRCDSLKSNIGYNWMMFSLSASIILNICEIMDID